jgi:iron-sulfur cluster assembly protein
MTDTTTDLDFVKIDTGIEGAEQGDEILISGKAIEVIHKVKAENNITEEYYLRLGTRSGGCSGISYALGFDSEIQNIDRTFEVDGIKLVIDAQSLFYFMGVTLDYTEGPEGSGFVFMNPNNFHSCGCQG